MTEAHSYREADLNRMVRALAGPVGVLTRDQLVEEVGASHWPRGRLEEALRAGIEQGRIRELGGDCYELSESERADLP